MGLNQNLVVYLYLNLKLVVFMQITLQYIWVQSWSPSLHWQFWAFSSIHMLKASVETHHFEQFHGKAFQLGCCF